jgi:hypothetical protein
MLTDGPGNRCCPCDGAPPHWSTKLNESKEKTIQSIANKKAMLEAKKAELRAMWEQCNQLRKSEDHDGMSSVRGIYFASLYSHF